jgi:hypothetical protein
MGFSAIEEVLSIMSQALAFISQDLLSTYHSIIQCYIIRAIEIVFVSKRARMLESEYINSDLYIIYVA